MLPATNVRRFAVQMTFWVMQTENATYLNLNRNRKKGGPIRPIHRTSNSYSSSMTAQPVSKTGEASAKTWGAGETAGKSESGKQDELVQALGELIKAAFLGDAAGVEKAANKVMACLKSDQGASGPGNAEPAGRIDQAEGDKTPDNKNKKISR